MTHPHRGLAIAALLPLALAPAALADPAGNTTRDETLAPAGGAFSTLEDRQGRALRRAPRRLGQGEGQARRQAPLAAHVRPAHRPADRRRDEPGAGGLRRSRGRRDQVVLAPAGGARAAGVRLDRAQRQREPAQRGPPGQRQAGASSRSRSRPATWPTTSSSTRRAGSRPCSTAGRWTRSPASRSRTECGDQPADRLAAHQRRRGRAPLHGRRRLRRLPRGPAGPLRRLLRPGRGRADAPARTPPSRATRACWTRPSGRSRPPGSTCRGTSRAATTTGWSRATRPPARTSSARSRSAA